MSIPLERGRMIRGIRLADDGEHAEANSDKIKGLVLKARCLRKA